MNYEIAHFDEIEAVPCPCGMSKRAFLTPENKVASIHEVEISQDARTHYHKRMTEIYLILEVEDEAFLELDGEQYPVRPMSTILIMPGCRHRAVGKMRIMNLAIPAFDPEDEWFD
ncbi:MAG: cupin domain-containing protein [Akkermansiaceae bacterium]